MNNGKPKKIKPKVFRILRNKFVLVSVGFLLWMTLFDQHDLIGWAKNWMEIKQMKQKKAYYEQELKTTTDALKELRSNNDSLEKFAREQYGFHNSDEDVFIVEE
jgi:cell division protein FtsB